MLSNFVKISESGSRILIQDLEKNYSGSRILGLKKGQIPDPDPQHWSTEAPKAVLPEATGGNSQPDRGAVGRRLLSPAIIDLVRRLPPTWPLDWVADLTETGRLQHIAAGAAKDANPRSLRRHEMFFNAKEREIHHGQMSGLIKAANPPFRAIFEAAGDRGQLSAAGDMDRRVQAVLLSLLMEQQHQGTLDRRLRRLFIDAFSPQVTVSFILAVLKNSGGDTDPDLVAGSGS
jgi:hypothetical protein